MAEKQSIHPSIVPYLSGHVRRNMAVIQVLPFLNSPKDLDPSYKMDLDFGGCFGRKNRCLITEEIQYVFNFKVQLIQQQTLCSVLRMTLKRMMTSLSAEKYLRYIDICRVV